MSGTNVMRFRLGVFVVAAGVLFATLIVMFGSLPTLFRRTTSYTVRFVDAPGLTSGAPVRRSGVRIGEVRDIRLDEDRGIVIAGLAIDAPYTLRRSEVPTLVIGILGTDASIDLVPKAADDKEPVDRSVIEAGSELVGTRAATVNTLLKGASDVVPTTQETLNDIRKSIGRLEKLATKAEKMLPLVEDTLRDYRDLARQAMPELEKTGSEARELIRSAREVVPEVKRTIQDYRNLAKSVEGSIPQVERTLEEFGQLAKDVRGVIPEFMKTNKAVQDLTRGVNDVLPMVEKTADEFGALATEVRKSIPTVRTAIEDVASTARGAGKLIEEVDIFWQKNQENVEQAIVSLNRTLKQTAQLLSEENIRKVERTLTNVSTSSEQLPKLSQNATELTEQAKITVKGLNDVLKQMETVLNDFQKITKPIGSRSDKIVKNVDEALDRVNTILGDFKALMGVLDRSNGTLRKILTDPSLYNSVDEAAVSVVKLIPRLDRILKDFEIFADKLARHPELLGVRGAVAPGTGLKNPPTPPIQTQPRPGSGTIFLPGSR